MTESVNENISFTCLHNKVIIRLRDRVCESSEELLASSLFREMLIRFVRELERKSAPLLTLFQCQGSIPEEDIDRLIEGLTHLEKLPISQAARLMKDGEVLLSDPQQLYEFVERFYDYWRSFERFIVCNSEGDRLDKRPYRTFNSTIESLTHLIRKVYRNVQESISGKHPAVYRQVSAGAEVAVIALSKPIHLPGSYRGLEQIPVIRQILLYPPLLLNPPMNKRTGKFERVFRNPIESVQIERHEWLCYPARVGELFILVYFHQSFYELGLSLSNLFEIADDDQLGRKPDAVYLYGVPPETLRDMAELPTVFYDDEENDLLIGAVPRGDQFGYFGYLKKMILTLHNIKMLKLGRLPYHGAMVKILLKGAKAANILLVGDTGAGKSESLEAFRSLAGDLIEEITIIADDMGSLAIDAAAGIIGYGTEIGAFVRLDDLSPGYAFGQLDRTIIMNPSQVNARVVLPVTSFENVVRGYPVDMVLYANNYENVDDEHPLVERFTDAQNALRIFREGTAMSKGTTTTTGLVHTYFVNVFGAVQYRAQHDQIAERFFDAFFRAGLFVGQLRTRLGIPGWERSGPEEAAKALLELIREK